MIVLGTRPDAIKLAPVIRAMSDSPMFDPIIINSGQHREMLQPLLRTLGLKPHTDLMVMRNRQGLSELTGALLNALNTAVIAEGPDLVVVHGDTTTALCGALAAAYERIPVAHVEAGLRTGSLASPFPEELNRQIIGRIARWHFAPTARAAAHLYAEGIPERQVITTGNTVIDNLHWMRDRKKGKPAFRTDRLRILVTLHRRETQGVGMRDLASVLRHLADRGDSEVLLPLHKSPAVRESLVPTLKDHVGITVCEPLDYPDFIATLANCDLVMTDSSGVQEEAPSLGKPVLILRALTERPEAVEAGVARLVGVEPPRVLAAASQLLDDPAERTRMAQAVNLFGDGNAAHRIVSTLIQDWDSESMGLAP
ncbi:UDP-N-acetylglucosamine 2-epimerase (non-hydrolyzing) [Actinomadura rudentiformis]|uniref:UDP-N-acetylglucosamine 2-epimerase (non-hydrolyzing) n=2 Tax=Actinomadura rudentiformis TaxID=359158 RepID=A0A6H9YFL8_9ACTN|nr:UDP-N-acetylglucosamine 2-epimerase (non-hydrolyzing) [Actinomadura rudentiformis]